MEQRGTTASNGSPLTTALPTAKNSPKKQHPEFVVPAIIEEPIAMVERQEEKPAQQRDPLRSPTHQQGHGRQSRQAKQEHLKLDGSTERVNTKGPRPRFRERAGHGAGEYALVSVVILQATKAPCQVHEDEQPRADPHDRERPWVEVRPPFPVHRRVKCVDVSERPCLN